jgi:four helix bundle protein
MASGVRELRVWQESVALAGDVIRLVRQTVRRETKVLSDSLQMTAVAVGSHLADGYARRTPAEQRDSYLAAKRALLRLETELAVARHADLIPGGSFTELTSRSSQVAQLLTGYLVYLDRQVAEDTERANGALRGEPASLNLDSVRVPS